MRLIDADDLMDVMGIAVECKDCPRNSVFGCSEDSAFVYACESITDAPTVDPVKHGRWIFSQNHAEGICTRCNFKIYGRPHNNTYMIVPYNYCPHCGAMMDEEE